MKAALRGGLLLACLVVPALLLFRAPSAEQPPVPTGTAANAAPESGSSSFNLVHARSRALEIAAAARAHGTEAPARFGPLPPPNVPVAAILPTLERQAQQGDARAACRVAFELKRCAQTGMRRRAIDGGQARIEVPERAKALHERLLHGLKELEALEALCVGITPEKSLEAWDYALAGALGGNREARWLAAFFPAGLDLMRPENTLEGWAEWQRYIGRILDEGILAGDPRMFALASKAYRGPYFHHQVFAPDPVRAAALMIAVANKRSANSMEQAKGDVDFTMNGLSPEQQAVARATVATLPPLTGIPAGGIDWSRGMGPDANGSECELP